MKARDLKRFRKRYRKEVRPAVRKVYENLRRLHGPGADWDGLVALAMETVERLINLPTDDKQVHRAVREVVREELTRLVREGAGQVAGRPLA